MWFRKKGDIQRLSLEVSKTEPPAETTPCTVDPARAEEVVRRTQQILDSGRIPEALYLCSVGDGVLTFRFQADKKPAMLLFSTPFSANDYLRFTNSHAGLGHFNADALPILAQSWIKSGVEFAVLDRCPRCNHLNAVELAGMTRWTREHFAAFWASHRASREVYAEHRIRSAFNHMNAKALAAARGDLEYVRDHFDCSVPYLHQMIGIIADGEGDAEAKAAATARLKEFGSQFEPPAEFSANYLATAMVGLASSFKIDLPDLSA